MLFIFTFDRLHKPNEQPERQNELGIIENKIVHLTKEKLKSHRSFELKYMQNKKWPRTFTTPGMHSNGSDFPWNGSHLLTGYQT